MDNLPEKQVNKLELEYVKSTYDTIAEDFSSTRYKKWPQVEAFQKSLPDRTLSLDIGCGNGKYLDNTRTYNIGCDLSLNLLRICKARGFEVVLCDMTKLPFRVGVFDSAICIAALHHITSSKRRQRCLTDITDLLDPEGGKCLVEVWSFEQNEEKNNPYLSRKTVQVDQSSHVQDNTAAAAAAAATRVTIGDEVQLPIHKNRTPFMEQDVLVPFHCKSIEAQHGESASHQLRYYHVFRKGELDEMFHNIPRIRVIRSYYDKGNWCIIAERGDAIISESEIGSQPT